MFDLNVDVLPQFRIEKELHGWKVIANDRVMATGLTEYMARLLAASGPMMKMLAGMSKTGILPTAIPVDTMLGNNGIKLVGEGRLEAKTEEQVDLDSIKPKSVVTWSRPQYVQIIWQKPFRMEQHHERFSIVDSSGRLVTEVRCGQYHGHCPTPENFMDTAEMIVAALNNGL